MMDGDDAAIRRLIAGWMRATHDGDVLAVLAMIAPDTVFLTPGQPPMMGRDAFAGNLRALLAGHTVDATSTVDEVVVDGDIAYSRTTLAVTVTPTTGGAPSTRRGATLSIWRRVDGQWLLTRDANLLGGPG